MTAALNDIGRISELLRFSTSIKVVQDFLRSKNVPFSAAGWDDLTNKRIFPYVSQGTLTVADFLGLLSTAEECGKQHVFLYECDPAIAARILDENRLLPVLQQRGLFGLMTNPLALDAPATATIVDIRLEKANVPLSLTVKEVYSHEAMKPTGSTRNGSQLTKTWDVVTTRAVNVAKLRRDGFLEIRLASVSEASYKVQLERFVRQLGDIIPVNQFGIFDLAKAKTRLSDDKDALSEKIRFSDTILKNENGTTVKVATGSRGDDLAQDDGARAGEDAFLGHHGAYADGHNFFLRAVPGSLSKEMLILMSGEANEFGIMANCDETDYDYVVRELRSLNN